MSDSVLTKLREWARMANDRSFSVMYRDERWYVSVNDRGLTPMRYGYVQSESLGCACDQALIQVSLPPQRMAGPEIKAIGDILNG